MTSRNPFCPEFCANPLTWHSEQRLEGSTCMVSWVCSFPVDPKADS